MFRSRFGMTIAALSCVACLAACIDDETSMLDVGRAASVSEIPAPTGLQNVAIGTEQLAIWPFTSGDFGTTLADPINLIFHGQSDPRALRAALLALNGDRTAFGMPDAYPFNCTWTDAHGDMQGAYASNIGWTANVVQLACGDYGPLRFHLRLFPVGDHTLANAHFEVLIPGTADHQVLHWVIAKQLVVADFVRSGLLGALPASTGLIHPAPGFRTIPAPLFNELPDDLKFLITGSTDVATEDVAIPNDGTAAVLFVAAPATLVPGSTSETLTFTYDQVIPRPFCSSGPLDYVKVGGPVTLIRNASLGSDGKFISELRTHGQLTITPVNPLTGEVIGETTTALINETHSAYMTDDAYQVSSQLSRKEVGINGTERAGLTVRFQVGDPVTEHFSRIERCGK